MTMGNAKDLARITKRIAQIGSSLTVAMTMCACAGSSGLGGTSWQEEVLLHDGRVIVVDRHFSRGAYPTVDAHERTLLDETLTFNLPGTNKKISWTTEFRDDVPERNSLGPLLLDIVNGIPYLATSPAGCIAYNKWGRPNPPYVLFKYVEGAWQQVPLKEFPSELVKSNLMNMPASSLLKPYYTVEDARAKREGGNVIAYAKAIVREPLAAYEKSCGEMVYDGNGGWIGIGWFREQPSYGACLKYCDRKKMSAQYCPCDTLFKGK